MSLDSTAGTSTGTIFPTFQPIANGKINRSLTATSCVLSVLGTLAIIFTYVLWKDVRTSSRKILVYISIADFICASAYLWSLFHEPVNKTSHTPLKTSCKVQSFITTCANMWSFMWTTFLAVFLYISVAKRRLDMADRMMPVFHFFGWLVPLVITYVAFLQHALGNDYDDVSAGWCWISSTVHNRIFWMLITGKAWEIAAYFLITVFYAMLKYHISREVKHRSIEFSANCSLEVARKAERKMTIIPVVFILLRIWGTTRFFLKINRAGHEDSNTSWLVYLQGVGDSGQGFANFMIFCFFTEKFQRRAQKLFYRYCCCKQKLPSSLTKEKPSAIRSRSRSRSANEQSLINESTHLIGPPSSDKESSLKHHR